MTVIQYPKMNAPDFQVSYLSADSDSVTRYCFESNLTGHITYNTSNHFSNGGGYAFQYYCTHSSSWKSGFGYVPIVHILNIENSSIVSIWDDNSVWDDSDIIG